MSGIEIKVAAEIDRIRKLSVGAENPFRLTTNGSLAVAQVETPMQEYLRAGQRFIGGSQSGATFMAGAAAIPSTAAQAQLWNGETGSNPKSYIVDFASFWEQGGTTVTSGGILFAALTPASIAAQAASTSWSIVSASGSSKSTKARLTQAPTAFAAGAVWIPVAITPANLTALLMGALSALPVPFLVPPGWALGFAAVGVAGTSPTYGLGLSWVEVDADLE